MVAPSQKRPVWRDGIIQIMITRACDQSCFHCTQGSNLAGKPVVMSLDEFEQALDSLGFYADSRDHYWGVVGVFGGNPAMHPQFDDICRLLRGRVPYQQRGLWCNNLRGKGPTARITFNPHVSNLNVHLDRESYEEFQRDWPESAKVVKGHETDSLHGPPFVAMKDVIQDEAERWKLIESCDINRFWSAAIGVVPGRGLRAYFCELAYSQAALHANDSDWPDTGLEVKRDWWKLPMTAFENQVNLHCHSCGIPLRAQGQLAIGGEKEQFSETHRSIAKPKIRERHVEFVQLGQYDGATRKFATEYLPGSTPITKAVR